MSNRIETTSSKEVIYSRMLVGLTLLNAVAFYYFGMETAFSFLAYLIYFIISTAAVYYLIFSIKTRKAFWWFFLVVNIYLTIHPGGLCLLIGVLRYGYYNKVFY